MLDPAPAQPAPEEALPSQSPPRPRASRRKLLVDVLQTTGEALLLFLIISVFTGRFEIHQVSMEPSLHEGQRVIVSKLERMWPSWLIGRAEAASPGSSAPLSIQHGQIVVLYRSENHTDDPLIKRVIGLPGDTVDVREGQVYVNGVLLDEPYIFGRRTNCNAYCHPVTLGPDEYFVMGDNRPNSLDSRSFGPVKAEQIVGRVIVRYWPLNQLALYP